MRESETNPFSEDVALHYNDQTLRRCSASVPDCIADIFTQWRNKTKTISVA